MFYSLNVIADVQLNQYQKEEQMMARIVRKMFLSSKMMGSGDAGDDHKDTLKLQELLSIMRLGATALADGDSTSVMTLDKFTRADAQSIISAAREQEKDRHAALEVVARSDATVPDSTAEEEENMRRVARVFSRLFEGKLVPRPIERSKAWELEENERAADTWEEIKKRARTDRLVTIDGMQFIADHIFTGDTVGVCFCTCAFATMLIAPAGSQGRSAADLLVDREAAGCSRTRRLVHRLSRCMYAH